MEPQDEGNADGVGLELQASESSIEYLLFIAEAGVNNRDILAQLEAIRKAALKLSHELTKDHIWQREEFNLELKNESGLLYLHGSTDYGDAVEDEWAIVYLLRELTSSHANLWVRVFDTDGEFLLVEAASVVPKWLTPENDHNRVWIHNGKLYLIPLGKETPSKRHITLSEAIGIIKTQQKDLVHSTFIEAEAFYRLDKYPSQIVDSIHHSLVSIPRKLAHILHALPRSVAPAVEAFYLRDALALKPVLSSFAPLVFPPEDFVTFSVRFSKILYAQLRSQRFEAPPRWQTPLNQARKENSAKDVDEHMRRSDAGMKLTNGFEILAAKASQSKSRVVRELAIILEDLEEDGKDALPTDDAIASWADSNRNDSETWLNINYEDFESELEGRRSKTSRAQEGGFGDGQTQENLRKIVSRFEAFLNDDQAGVEGAEIDELDVDDDEDDDDEDEDGSEDSDAEDKEISFDEEEFARMMHEMMGLPSTASNHQSKSQATEVGPPKKATEDDEIRNLTSEFEAELNSHGALTLDPAGDEKQPRIKGKGKGKKTEEEEENTDDEVDVDYNLAKNLLESFKSQGGMPGPTGNLLGMMGLQLPRDEDDGSNTSDDDQRRLPLGKK